jgi:hypothetical protein
VRLEGLKENIVALTGGWPTSRSREVLKQFRILWPNESSQLVAEDRRAKDSVSARTFSYVFADVSDPT